MNENASRSCFRLVFRRERKKLVPFFLFRNEILSKQLVMNEYRYNRKEIVQEKASKSKKKLQKKNKHSSSGGARRCGGGNARRNNSGSGGGVRVQSFVLGALARFVPPGSRRHAARHEVLDGPTAEGARRRVACKVADDGGSAATIAVALPRSSPSSSSTPSSSAAAPGDELPGAGHAEPVTAPGDGDLNAAVEADRASLVRGGKGVGGGSSGGGGGRRGRRRRRR